MGGFEFPKLNAESVVKWGCAGAAVLGLTHVAGVLSARAYDAESLGFADGQLRWLVADPLLCELAVAMKDTDRYAPVEFRRMCMTLNAFCEARERRNTPRMLVAQRKARLAANRSHGAIPKWDVRTRARVDEVVPDLEAFLADEVRNARMEG